MPMGFAAGAKPAPARIALARAALESIMIRPPRRNHLALALYLNAIMLGILIVVLVSRDSGTPLVPAALAQPVPRQQPIAGGAGLFMMPAQFAVNIWGVYLMDVDQQTLCAYQYLPGEKQLRLVAARNFTYDRKLHNYNTEKPTPAEVRDLIEKEQASERVKPPGGAPERP
jgi:hypothetical protein